MELEINSFAGLHKIVTDLNNNYNNGVGKQVCGLHIGEVSGRPPEHIIESTIRNVKTKNLGYTPTRGNTELIDLICNDLRHRKHFSINNQQVIITNGSKQGLFYAINILIDKGDEVIIHTPYWNSYQKLVEMSGGVLKTLPLETDGNLNLQVLGNMITDKTKMIIICSPHNPTGTIPDIDNMNKLADLIKDKNIVILSDEIYEQLDYNNHHHSFAHIASIRDKVITVGGFSKSHQMTGYRVGYLVAPESIITNATVLQANICTCACTLSQYVAIDAIKHIDDVNRLVLDLRQRLSRLLVIFENYPHWETKGAFYLFVNITKKINSSMTDTDICKELLSLGVGVAPGSLFNMPGHIRISYACSDEMFEIAVPILYKYFS